MRRPNDSDVFELCHSHLKNMAPALLMAMEDLVRRHPLLSGDLEFYMAVERLLMHAPPHYLPTIREFHPETLHIADPHDVERARFFCFRSDACRFPQSFLFKEFKTLQNRLQSERACGNERWRECCKAVCAFYLGLCVHLWQRFGPTVIVAHARP